MLNNLKFPKHKYSAILIRGSVGSLFVRIAGTISAFLMQVFLARMIGPSEFGVFNYSLSWLVILTLLAKMGMDNSLIRFVSQYESQGNIAHIKAIFFWASRNALVSSIAISCIAVITATIIPQLSDTHSTPFLLITIAILPLSTVTAVRQGFMRGLKRIVLADAPEGGIRQTIFIAFLFAAWLSSTNLNAQLSMVLMGTAYAVSLTIGLFWMWRAWPKTPHLVTDEHQQRKDQWLQVSLSLMLLQGFQILLARTDIIMLGWFTDTKSVGVYAATSRLAELATFGLLIINPILAPMISELHTKGSQNDLQRIITLAARFSASFMMMATLALLLFGDWILSMFGSTFRLGYPALVIIVVGNLINAACGSVGYIMAMTGHQNTSAFILGSAAVLNIILNVVLIPHFGIEGAAIATSISMIYWNIFMVIVIKLRMGLNPTIISFRTK